MMPATKHKKNGDGEIVGTVTSFRRYRGDCGTEGVLLDFEDGEITRNQWDTHIERIAAWALWPANYDGVVGKTLRVHGKWDYAELDSRTRRTAIGTLAAILLMLA